MKHYLRISFELASALCIGANESYETDRDTIVDSANKPFIPGSSLAGVYRSFLKKEIGKEYFGYEDDKGDDNSVSNQIKVYDACLDDDKYYFSKRDSVALDEYRVAKDGAKFDELVVNKGARFITYIESENKDIINYIAYLWQNDLLRFGSKTSRGQGEVKLNKLEYCSFDLSNIEDKNKWLIFDMYGNRYYEEYNEKVAIDKNILLDNDNIKIELDLNLCNAISIRRYAATGPDYEQLTTKASVKEKGVPIIPGSSWAGSFKHHIEDKRGKQIDLFGNVDERKKEASKSKIVFSETIISGGEEKELTRNAIDRFTGGAQERALYTEKTHYGGQGKLIISFPDINKYREMIADCVADLNMGFLAVGGLSSIGRGIFKVESLKINNVEISLPQEEIQRSKELYKHIKEGK